MLLHSAMVREGLVSDDLMMALVTRTVPVPC